MLNNAAFANSLAILIAVSYVIVHAVRLVSPPIFEFLFNAQFLGAKVASLIPREFSWSHFIGTLVTVVISGWIFGYFWAWLYNLLAK